MVNVLGAKGFTGDAHYKGFHEVMAIPGAHVHLYGKQQTKPFRKMGHVTVTAPTLEEAKINALKVQQTLQVVSV
jgi:5-(carboxyamino)imidazole ribonucleotide synthase